MTACVLRVGGYWAGDCDAEVAKAYELLASPELSADIADALKGIIDKNGNEAFKLYMTGYVTFFNETTDLCDHSSFKLYSPQYDSTHEETGQPFLTKIMRKQLNDVVTALNDMLKDVAKLVNDDHPIFPKVVFVDPNPAYAGHRWCEDGVYEPDNDRLDTWLFLSSTPDNNLPKIPLGALESEKKEYMEQLAGPGFSLPDPLTCKTTLACSDSVTSNDWYGK